MDLTTIQFIGLMIITNLTNNGGQVIIGVVPGLVPTHDAVVAFKPNELLRAEIAQTVATVSDIDEEIRHLMQVAGE